MRWRGGNLRSKYSLEQLLGDDSGGLVLPLEDPPAAKVHLGTPQVEAPFSRFPLSVAVGIRLVISKTLPPAKTTHLKWVTFTWGGWGEG